MFQGKYRTKNNQDVYQIEICTLQVTPTSLRNQWDKLVGITHPTHLTFLRKASTVSLIFFYKNNQILKEIGVHFTDEFSFTIKI